MKNLEMMEENIRRLKEQLESNPDERKKVALIRTISQMEMMKGALETHEKMEKEVIKTHPYKYCHKCAHLSHCESYDVINGIRDEHDDIYCLVTKKWIKRSGFFTYGKPHHWTIPDWNPNKDKDDEAFMFLFPIGVLIALGVIVAIGWTIYCIIGVIT